MEITEKEDGTNIEALPPHSDAILYLGQYEKVSVPIGRLVPIADVTKKSPREIIRQDQRVITADHDWNDEKVIPYVTLFMNITETAGKSLYSGGTN